MCSVVTLVASIFSSAAWAADAAPAAAEMKPPLKVAIAVPAGKSGVRTVTLARPESHFHVVLTNTSDKPLTLWREWCSWGYYNLAFEYTDEGGMLRRIAKVERGWRKNFPDPFVLPAGEHFVYDVHFGDAEIWKGVSLDERAAAGTKLKLRAVFEILPDPDAARDGVWTGRIVSPEVELTFYK
jgi:hypothetical protein